MTEKILIVDDELSMREFLAILLEREGYQVQMAENAETALRLLGGTSYDLVISDVNMPGLDGIALLDRIKSQVPDTAVLMITAFSDASQAVEAMKLGAYDYLSKPFKVEEIKVLVRNALEKRNLQRENMFLRKRITEQFSFSGLIGKSKKMHDIFTLIEKVAASTANILIFGESGTGKELVAKAIHFNSQRREKPFVAVNCGAIPETLMESELFGHKRGAFTGAVADRPGLFEQADGGTLFLDEIGEIPLLLQAKLLRVLQEREVRRIGASEDRRVDVRIVAASNRVLEEQVKDGLFREDLYYRLNVVQIDLPSLRERPEDISLLIEHFYGKLTGREPVSGFIDTEALKLLLTYPFPGNVRELENLVERALALGAQVLSLDALPPQVSRFRSESSAGMCKEIPETGMNLEAHLDGIEKHYLLQALDRSGGVKKRAAELLGLTFRSFRYRLAKFGMDEDHD
jgi:two-component system response regulator PilR (NtrC family)